VDDRGWAGLAGVVFDGVGGDGDGDVRAPAVLLLAVALLVLPELPAAVAMPAIAPAPRAPVTIAAPRSFEMFISIGPPSVGLRRFEDDRARWPGTSAMCAQRSCKRRLRIRSDAAENRVGPAVRRLRADLQKPP
jgi:hypothetical protein